MLLMVAAMLCSSLYAGSRMVTGGFLLISFMEVLSVERVNMITEVSQNLRDIARFEWWFSGVRL